MYIEVVLPLDMLWQDEESEQYDKTATHDKWVDQLERELEKHDYHAGFVFRNVAHMIITDGYGKQPGGIEYDLIRHIIDTTEVDYIAKD